MFIKKELEFDDELKNATERFMIFIVEYDADIIELNNIISVG